MSSCHKCKTMIPVNEENTCKAGLIELAPQPKKTPTNNLKKKEPCNLKFCGDCLEKHYRESLNQFKKSKFKLKVIL